MRLFDDLLSRLLGHEELVSCEFRPRCGEYLVVEHNGDLYACDFFVDADHCLGNLTDRPLLAAATGEAFATFAAAKGQLADGCGACEWLSFCQGGCPRHRLFPQGTIQSRTYLCEGYRRFFSHALPALREFSTMSDSG